MLARPAASKSIGLAAGEEGVVQANEILKSEIARAMALLGRV
jgi:isopentenyl diphosphate isomerase/L-lactate dehydrogenase-like FMN-dependent dehydrogenase